MSEHLRTHWEGCWRDRAHHGCAVAEVERLWAVMAWVAAESHDPIVTERLNRARASPPPAYCKVVVDIHGEDNVPSPCDRPLPCPNHSPPPAIAEPTEARDRT